MLRHRAAVRHLQGVAVTISADCLEDIGSLDDWEKRRAGLRQHLLWLLGLNPLPERSPLNARITGTLSRPGYSIEKLVFESQPGLFVTANFYLPTGRNAPVPCVLYLCGHAKHPGGAKTALQDRFLWYPRNGFACLVMDPLEFGEVPGIHHGTHNLNLWHWYSLGYTPAGVEVWNATRALDWLEGRREVDARRIGVTGMSGGGMTTWYLSATDERVQVAAPSCTTLTVGSIASAWSVRYQCDCTCTPNTPGFDFPLLGALVAPRPLLIMNGRRDPYFPPAGFRQSGRKICRIYALHGDAASHRIREVEANTGHEEGPAFLREVRTWMRRWLMPEAEAVRAAELDGGADEVTKPSELACLQGPPSTAANYHVHETFIRRASLTLPPNLEVFQRRRAELMAELRRTVFAWFPQGTIPFATRVVGTRGDYAGLYARFSEVQFDAEPGVPVRCLFLQPRDATRATPLVLVVRRGMDNVAFPDLDHLLPVLSRNRVLILNPRFSEAVLSPADVTDLERTAALTGRTIAAMQVWDALRAVKWALEDQKLSPAAITVCGRGHAGITALYAALFEELIGQVVLEEPLVSHRSGPPLLNVLRMTDVPEVVGAIAPRRVTCLPEIPREFELARGIFELCGSGGQLRSAGSIAEAVLN
jgi:cephalosporin-C deacetylase-like acetyl esterase